MQINKLIEAIKVVFTNSWETISMLEKEDKIGFFLQNWMQANWEMILETFLCQKSGNFVILDHYGEGAEDLHHSLLKGQICYNRVSLPSMPPTHTILCTPIEKKIKCSFSNKEINFRQKGLVFGELVAIKKGKVELSPPFDHALLLSKPYDYVAPIDQLNFSIVPVDESIRK